MRRRHCKEGSRCCRCPVSQFPAAFSDRPSCFSLARSLARSSAGPLAQPTEFANQDAFALATKATFPGTRILQYRITGAVPYDALVHSAIVEHPEYFVRWSNGSVCQMWFEESGTTGHNCSWPIRASAYDFSQAVVRDWFLENIIKPVMVRRRLPIPRARARALAGASASSLYSSPRSPPAGARRRRMARWRRPRQWRLGL